MADQYRRGYEDDYRQQGGRGWTDRAGDEMRAWFGDDDARARRERDERERGWRDQGDGSFERSRESWRGTESWRGGDRAPYGQGQYGSSGSTYGGSSSYGRSYPDSEFQPHRAVERQGQGGDWRARSTSGQGDWNETPASWRGAEAGSYRTGGQTHQTSDNRHYGGGYSRGGGGRFGGDVEWSTGGGNGGGETSLRGGTAPSARQSYSGRGPKDYKRSDDRIREDVSDRLEQDHAVDASDISVQVRDGEVTLSGTVTSRDQKRRAEDCVESVMGVKDVSNHLRVSRQDQAEMSSSLLGLGGQPSRDATSTSSGNGAQQQSPGKANKSSSTGSSGSSGLSA